MGLVVASPDTLVTLGDISFSNTKLYVSMLGFLLVAVMSCQQVHGALLIGIFQISVCSWIMGICPPPEEFLVMPRFDFAMSVDFSAWSAGGSKLTGMLLGTAVLFFVALFDLAGVQYGLCSLANLLKDGVVPRSTEIFSSAALGTMSGALLGTSPLIIANESSAGIMEGARTGLSTIVVGFLFALSAFISPLLAAIPHLATAAPLVLIGAFMMGPIGGIDWDKLHIALPSFVTCTVVPFTYSIHTGILAGILMDSVLQFMMWWQNGCRKKKSRVDSGQETPPDRFPTPPKPGSGMASPGRRPSVLSSAHQSGRSTPLSKRFQSPHAHTYVGSFSSPGADKEERVEKLLDELRLASVQGKPAPPRDEMLIQALEDYLQLGLVESRE
jgi:xanthine/uracil/vitamin C permease (AzgA family)